MKMIFISKKRETLLFLITNLLVKGEEIFQTIPETLTLPENGRRKGEGKKEGAQKAASARPANSFLATFSP